MGVEDKDIEELAIVAEPGVMQGARIAGALNGLKEKGIKSADYLIGSSSAVPCLAYYCSDELWKGTPIWTEEVADESPWDFVGLVQRAVKLARKLNDDKCYFEIDRLVDEHFTENYPLSLDSMEDSNSKFVVPLTNADTGEAEYMSEDNLDNFYSEEVLLDLLRATMAEPFTYGQTVEIDGEEYFDGAFASPIPVDAPQIEDAFKIVIRTKHSPPAMTKEKDQNMLQDMYQDAIGWCYERTKDIITAGHREGFQEAVKNEYEKFREKEEKLDRMEEKGEALVIEADSYVSRLRDDLQAIEENMRGGREDVMESRELDRLVEFLDNSPKGLKYLVEG